MSSLANLLNPAPSSDPNSNSTHANHGSSHPHHSRDQSLTSPLEALAIAATSSPPVQSPTHPITAPLAPSTGHQRSYSGSSSRPSSSHFSIPMFHALAHPSPSFSPAFDSHAPTNNQMSARKLSDIADGTSRQLPPLRTSLTDEMDTSTTVGAQDTSMTDAQDPFPNPHLQQLPPIQDTLDRITDDQLEPSSTPGQVITPIKPETTPVVSPDEAFYRPPPTPAQFYGTSELSPTQVDSEASQPGVIMQREDGTQGLPDRRKSDTQVSVHTNPQPVVASRKRPAPKSDKKIEKKGTASTIKKPTAKKRKLDPESTDGTPISRRSGTPASSRASKTPAPRTRKQGSTTPLQSSPPPPSTKDEPNDDEDNDEDSELFCICRKPDDHTWMIACDGGCDDWFHGRCVAMNERDGNLIDKYICPNCREKGVGVTTWKPMCRLKTCREPARVLGSQPSKYCCDEHGELYMRMLALGKNGTTSDNAKSGSGAKRRRKDNMTDHTGNGADGALEDEVDDAQAYLRGGILRAGELKALTSGVKDVEEFRKLGEGVLSPPRTVSPDEKHAKMHDGDAMSKEKLKVVHTAEEKTQLSEIASRKDSLKHQREALGDREKLLGLCKSRARVVLEELRKKEGIKEICGFDSRLTWSDDEFEAWRTSSEGQSALKSGQLGAPAEPAEDDGDEKMTNGDSAHAEEIGRGVCQKKRCERHKNWMKLQTQGIAFEKDACRQEMRKLEKEEKGVEERAMMRHLEGGGDEEVGRESAPVDDEMKD